ncbi:MAG TPA: hypothetical protein VHQ41_03910 [Patescibacteria group bacterium]|jgi:hypothetical protein|nr:hypothetical protein [Patescibacteria group bacterium]
MFEHHSQPLISREQFTIRVVKFALGASLLVGGSWLIGIIGYKVLEGMSWIDAVLNSAMILGGMGPVNALTTDAGKIFASFYALFSGVIFLVSIGVMAAPVVHRLFHQFHGKK